jgi:hypothetical protein
MNTGHKNFVPISEIPLELSDEEHRVILESWKETDHDNEPQRDENGEIIDHNSQVLEGLTVLARLLDGR